MKLSILPLLAVLAIPAFADDTPTIDRRTPVQKFEAMKAKADAGDDTAMFCLGNAYMAGKGADKDLAKARVCFDKAATSKDSAIAKMALNMCVDIRKQELAATVKKWEAIKKADAAKADTATPQDAVKPDKTPKPSDDGLSKEEIAARDFAIDGVKLGTTIEGFLKQHPDADQVESKDSSYGALKYIVLPKHTVHGTTYEFINKKLYSIHDLMDRIDIDGEDDFIDKTKKKFGVNPDVYRNTEAHFLHMTWSLDGVSRKVEYIRIGRLPSFVITDTMAESDLQKIKESKPMPTSIK